MSRSLLIVICDFLVLSLLALARFDSAPPNLTSAQGTQPMQIMQTAPVPAAPPPDASYFEGKQDLVAVLGFALEEEKQSREKLLSDLQNTQSQLSRREEELSDREKRIQEFQENLRQREEEARRLDEQRAALQAQYAAAQATMKGLEERLSSTAQEAQTSQSRVAALQNELRQRQHETERMQQEMQGLEQARQVAEVEKQRLSTELKVSEAEKGLFTKQIETMRGEVQTVRQEKAQIQKQTEVLTSEISTLAHKSSNLTEEVRQNRPLAPNAIFNDFVTNRLQAQIRAGRKGFFGQDVVRDRQSKTVLVTDGTETYALFHMEDTPLSLREAGTDWNWLAGTLRRGIVTAPIQQLGFLSADPRVVVAPLDAVQARRLGVKVYSLAQDPFRFEEAVLIGTTEGYYGESEFRLRPERPQYVKMDRALVRVLFGNFAPSRGDLVFSKSGEVIGMMVNDEYCAVLQRFMFLRSVRAGWDISNARTGEVMDELKVRVEALPLDLQ